MLFCLGTKYCCHLNAGVIGVPMPEGLESAAQRLLWGCVGVGVFDKAVPLEKPKVPRVILCDCVIV